MEEDWIEYQCKSGQTMFVYNKVTGEHKWPHGLPEEMEYRIICGRHKPVCTVATQTDNSGCNNGCMSMYLNTDSSLVPNTSDATSPQQQPSVLNGENGCLNSEPGPEITVKLENTDEQCKNGCMSMYVSADLPQSDGALSPQQPAANACQENSFAGQVQSIKIIQRDEQEEDQSSRMVTPYQDNKVENSNGDGNVHSVNTADTHHQEKYQKWYKISEMLTAFKKGTSLNEFDVIPERSGGNETFNNINVQDYSDSIFFTSDNTYADNIHDIRYSHHGDTGNSNNDYIKDYDKDDDDDDDDDQLEINWTNNATDYHENIRKDGRVDSISKDVASNDNMCVDVFKNESSVSDTVNKSSKVVYKQDPDIEVILPEEKQFQPGTSEMSDKTGTTVGHVADQHTANLAEKKRQFNKKKNKSPYECSVCKKVLKSNQSLQRHSIVHTGEKKIECNLCHKKFSFKFNLDVHLRRHTGEKPFECNYCQKRFCTKCSLNTHIRIHTKERPFECTICKKKFSQRSNMYEHVKIHTGEKRLRYECIVCKKTFTRKRALESHARTHR